MNDNIEKLQQLLLGDDGLLILLRLRQGLDLKKVEKIEIVLKELAIEWKMNDCIPKKAADIFVDFYPAMESVATHYSGDEAEKIIEVADNIMDLIRDCICS